MNYADYLKHFLFYMCLASDLKNIRIDPERPKVLVGDTLVLNCSGETTYNGRIGFEWQFNKGQVRYGAHATVYLLFPQ